MPSGSTTVQLLAAAFDTYRAFVIAAQSDLLSVGDDVITEVATGDGDDRPDAPGGQSINGPMTNRMIAAFRRGSGRGRCCPAGGTA